MKKLQIKIFRTTGEDGMETAVNEFLKANYLVTEDFIDFKITTSALPSRKKEDPDGIVFIGVLIYRK